MNKARENLKIYSIIILATTAITLIRFVVGIATGGLALGNTGDAVVDATVRTAVIVTLVVGLILLIPQIYVGLKGLKIAKDPSVAGKAHIVWAVILTILCGISTISAISTLLNSTNLANDIIVLLDNLIDVVIYIGFIKCAKQVAKA